MRTCTIAALLVCTLIIGVAIGSAGERLEIVEGFRAHDIKFVLSGLSWVPTTTDGTTLSPIIVDGVSYLPVRAIAEAVGLEVVWDEATRTITLGGTPIGFVPPDSVRDLYFLEGELTLPEEVMQWRDTLKLHEGVYIKTTDAYQHVLIAMGEQMTGGYKVELESITLDSTGWTIVVSYKQPAPDEMVTQAITYPYLLVSLLSDAAVTVEKLGQPGNLYIYETDGSEQTSDITITAPIPFQALAGTITISGQAKTDDAVYIELEDGHTILINPIELNTTPGDQAGWVTFTATLDYPTPTSPGGTLHVFTGEKSVLIPVLFQDWDYEAK